jgi:hypothetical protein
MSHRNEGIEELTVSSECDTKGHVCGIVGFEKVSIGNWSVFKCSYSCMNVLRIVVARK